MLLRIEREQSLVNSIGLDLVEIARIKTDLERFGRRFAERILSVEELRLFDQRRDRELFLAGRFAAKEAVIKGLGFYLTDRPAFSQIEIINDQTGRPHLRLAHSVQQKLGSFRCLISITHEKNYAAAVAVFLEEK